MIRVAAVLPAGTWSDPADEVLIDFDRRHRRRIVLTTEAGAAVLIDFPQAVRLRDGDGLALEGGGAVRVRARPEPLLEIHAHDEADLVRIAWHLGNRHLLVQLLGDRIRIRADHVIEAMVEGLGGHVEPIEAPFDPEAGAYAPGTLGIIITATTTMRIDARPARGETADGGAPIDFAANLIRLQTWLSPAFPTGAFVYSHALEWAVETQDISDAATLERWLGGIIAHGTGRADTILLRLAHRAARAPVELRDIAALARATASSRERRDEALAQGAAFQRAAANWDAPDLPADTPYAVAVGAMAGAHGIDEDTTAAAYLQAFATNLISAAVRLVPLGQTDGLKTLAALEPIILSTAAETKHAGPDDLGGCAFRSDIAAMRHETQYTRLFRS